MTAAYDPGWTSFDVTERVQQWEAAAGTNFGWRIAQMDSGGGDKIFYSSEYLTDPTLRPKLTVVYATGGGGGNQLPTVSLTAPAAGSSVALGGSFNLTANAADSDGTVAKVEFFANGIKIGQALSAPYALTWTPAAAGSYALTAVATDNVGGAAIVERRECQRYRECLAYGEPDRADSGIDRGAGRQLQPDGDRGGQRRDRGQGGVLTRTRSKSGKR